MIEEKEEKVKERQGDEEMPDKRNEDNQEMEGIGKINQQRQK